MTKEPSPTVEILDEIMYLIKDVLQHQTRVGREAMDLILLYRMVILDIIIMLFLLAYGLYCKKYDESTNEFIPFAVICLIYSIFGFITEVTVNSTSLPPKLNDICHIFYFTFGLLFSFVYLKYVLKLFLKPQTLRYMLILAGIVSAICIAAMLFADIDYVQGAGTRYSQGLGPTLCYALGFLFIIVSDVIVIIKKKSIENSVWYALIPITFVAIILLIIQIVYPMFLFSESAIVLVCLGAFFAIEDPVGRFKKTSELYYNYAYIDGLTGLFNRRAYTDELNKYSDDMPKDIICISMDLNGLKQVNDTVGHEAGDELIIGAANIINEVFGQYGKVFRTGGDEYYGIIRTSREKYNEALTHLNELCASWKGKYSSDMKISVGACLANEEENDNIRDIAIIADQRMYDNKVAYYRAMGIDRLGQAAAHKALCELYTKILKINVTDDTYSIINMDISEQTREKGFADSISGWLRLFGESGQVHPEDLEKYLKYTNIEYMREYFAGNKTSLCIFYRRKYEDTFKQVMMEIIPADDYSDDNQSLFLYVNNVEK